jgi:hypothetical protein
MGPRSLCGVAVLSLIIPCGVQAGMIVHPSRGQTQGPDISNLVPRDLSFATAFVQTLSDSGWTVQSVRHSIFNGGIIPQTRKAAWIKTEKGVLEVLFFEKLDDLEQVQIKEDDDSTPSQHKYTVTTGNESHQWGGRLPVYFAKYRNVLIITYDSKLNDAIRSTLKISDGHTNPGRA